MYKFLEKIVHTIVPHEKNRNIPHILKETTMGFMFFAVLLLFVLSSKSVQILRSLNLTATVYPAVIADLTNKDRVAEGLGELKWNATLAEAAQMKAEDMIKNGYFAHTSPTGVTPWFWLTSLKYHFFYAGENLAIRFNESDAVQNAWLNSPTHKANIMNGKFKEIGIAAVDGVYQGNNTTFVVEYFGTAAEAATLPPPIVPTTPPAPAKAVTPKVTPPKPKVVTPTPKPVVAGAETENPVVAVASTPEVNQDFKTIQEDHSFVAVQNTTPNLAVKPLAVNAGNSIHPAWYQRLVANPSNAVRSTYLLIIGAIMTAMALMLFKEYERHHLKHFALGFGMIAVLVCLIYFIPSTVLFV